MTIVGTWNLENLFRTGDDGPSGEEEYDAKLDSLAATITDLAPDLLAVQEVGDPDALDDLVKRLDGDWHTGLADPDAGGIRVGILSRHALSDVEQVADYPQHLNPVQVDDEGHTIDQLGRPGLRARVGVDGTSLDIVSAHLKSKLLSFPGGDSPRGTRTSAPASASTPCTAEPQKRPASAPTSPRSWTGRARTVPSSWPAT
jgi:hypothetical protein